MTWRALPAGQTRFGDLPRRRAALAAALVCLAAMAPLGCDRRECYPICPSGYAPAPRCKCVPAQPVADADASAAPSDAGARSSTEGSSR